MNIYEFADIIGKNILITRFNNQGDRFCAYFEGGEIKYGSVLISKYGNGKTPTEAINAYKNNIVGQTLVFNATSNKHRRECTVPKMDDIKATS